MTTQRSVVVDGTTYDLPTRWGSEDVDSLMAGFQTTMDDWVAITQERGVVHVLVRPTTQVAVVIAEKTVSVPRRIK